MAAAKAEAWDKAQAAWAAVAVAKAEAAAMAKAEAAWAAAAEAQALAREMQESSERKVAPPPSAASPPQASQQGSPQGSPQGCLTPLRPKPSGRPRRPSRYAEKETLLYLRLLCMPPYTVLIPHPARRHASSRAEGSVSIGSEPHMLS